MAEMHGCSAVIFQQIKILFKFNNSKIKVYSKIRQYFPNNLKDRNTIQL